MAEVEALRREGFQRSPQFAAAETPPPNPADPLPPGTSPPHEPLPPSEAPLQAPLPPQVKLDQPAPLEPLSPWDEARKELREQAEKWPITVHLLYKPIKDNTGKEIWEISFREPKATDINRIGQPVRMLWDNEPLIEERKMTYIIAQLSGIYPPMIEEMDPRDWHTCALRLRKFFLPNLRGW